MTRYILPALLLGSCAAAQAVPVTTVMNFTRDDGEFVATVTTDAAGQTIVGHELRSGAPFSLRVARGRVTGYYNDRSVSYPVSEAGAAPLKTASR